MNDPRNLPGRAVMNVGPGVNAAGKRDASAEQQAQRENHARGCAVTGIRAKARRACASFGNRGDQGTGHR